MQILIVITLSLTLIGFILYKINKKFGLQEIITTVLIALVIGVGSSFLTEKKEKIVQNIFKQKYENSTNSKILKIKAQRLNNKNVSSSNKFIYKFDLIVSKKDKEFVCTINEVIIKKIEDEFIIGNYKESCIEK